jgi:hypothetical protein
MPNKNEEQIRKMIQEQVEKPAISLSSSQILAHYNEREEAKTVITKRRFSFRMKLITSLALGAVVLTSVGLLAHSLLKDGNKPIIPEPPTPIVIDGGKQGEFLFMCSSSLNYAPGGSNPISPRFRALFTDEEKAAIEDALDQALPLVNDFYNANVNYQFEVIEGTFVSPYTEEEYTQKFIINGSIEILANIEFEFDDEESEKEIEGEIFAGDNFYLIEGEQEIDTADNESDFSLKIYYNEDSYLEIESENEDNEQEFSYKLILDDEEVFFLKLEGHIQDSHNRFDVEIKTSENDFEFVIEKLENSFYIEYLNYAITATYSNNKYTYTYEEK